MGNSESSTLTIPTWDFDLNQRVETEEGEWIIIGRTTFGFPGGIYLVALSDERLWKHPEEIEPLD